MRWNKRKEPKRGDERICSGFLFFPLSMHNPITCEYETRWLEYAYWEEYWNDDWLVWKKSRWLEKGKNKIK